MSDDPEYDDLCRHEKKIERMMKKAHLRSTEPECCYMRKNADHGYEGEINCGLIQTDKLIGKSVGPLQVCNLFACPVEMKEDHKTNKQINKEALFAILSFYLVVGFVIILFYGLNIKF